MELVMEMVRRPFTLDEMYDFFFSKDNIISNNGIKKKYKTVGKQLLL